MSSKEEKKRAARKTSSGLLCTVSENPDKRRRLKTLDIGITRTTQATTSKRIISLLFPLAEEGNAKRPLLWGRHSRIREEKENNNRAALTFWAIMNRTVVSGRRSATEEDKPKRMKAILRVPKQLLQVSPHKGQATVKMLKTLKAQEKSLRGNSKPLHQTAQCVIPSQSKSDR